MIMSTPDGAETVRPDVILDEQGNVLWFDNPNCLRPEERLNLAGKTLKERPYLNFYLERYSMRDEVDQEDRLIIRGLGGLAVVGELIGTAVQSTEIQFGSPIVFAAAVLGLGIKKFKRWNEDRILRSNFLI